MRGDYIEFISAYCDSWCERCPFTSRCSAFAIEMAIGMCEGNVREGMELAISAPRPATEAERDEREEILETIGDFDPSPAELAQFSREQEAQEERIDGQPLSSAATRFQFLAARWLRDHREAVEQGAEAALREALSVAAWDCHLIAAKLHRALIGRDASQRGMGFGDHPVQNDWNGSAKVALLSTDRSLDAWRLIADRTRDPDARHIADELGSLRAEAEQTFPQARTFRRPGFDA